MAGCVTGMLYPWEFRARQTFSYFPPPYPVLSLTGRFLPSPVLPVVENAPAGVASVGIFCLLLVTPRFLLARWQVLSRPSRFRSSEISPAGVASVGFFFLFPATFAAFPGMLAGSLPSPVLPVIGNTPGIRGNFSHIPGRRRSTSVTTLPHQHPPSQALVHPSTSLFGTGVVRYTPRMSRRLWGESHEQNGGGEQTDHC